MSSDFKFRSGKYAGFELKNMQRAREFSEELWQIPNFLRIDHLMNFSQVSDKNGDINIAPFLNDPETTPWTQAYLNQKRI